MRLHRVSIAGFFNFPAVATLNLADIPLGLIAVTGTNGAGKTRFLDAPFASLYGPGSTRAFPSREGRLADYVTSPTAMIESVWDLHGRQLRARVSIDRTHRKTEAVLEDVGIGVVNTDGLIDSFREAVSERFPSLRSLLASGYATQTRRGSFAELGQKERLELFVELADLAHLETRSQTAKRCAEVAETFAIQLRAQIAAAQRDTSAQAVADAETRLEWLARSRTDLDVRATLAQTTVQKLDAQRAQHEAHARDHAAAKARAIELHVRIGRATSAAENYQANWRARQQEHQTRDRARDARLTEATAGLANRRLAIVLDYQQFVKDRTERLANNEMILGEADAIRAAAAKVEEATADLAAVRETLARTTLNHAAAVEQVRLREHEIAGCVGAQRELDEARQRTEMLVTVKFGEPCAEDPACPLVTDVVAVRARIPDLEAIVARRQEWQDGVDHWKGIALQELRLQKAHEASIRDLEETIATHSQNAKRLAVLDHATERITEYRRDLAAAETRHAEALKRLDGEAAHLVAQHKAETQRDQDAYAAALQEATAASEALGREVEVAVEAAREAQAEAHATAGAQAALDQLHEQLRAATADQSECQAALARLDVEQATVTRQLADLRARAAHVQEAEGRLRQIEDEGLAWATLAKALGRDGLQRLEIDAAGPVVSDLANQLLEVGYGTRFSLQLVTQVATAKGDDMKERFTILCRDNAHAGEPRDIGDLSGGERVVVEEALRAALSCYVNLRSRTPSQTIFRDETTGALDPENAPRYVAMLRKLREISGADQILFVTHNPMCAALADAVVRVENGQAIIEKIS